MGSGPELLGLDAIVVAQPITKPDELTPWHLRNRRTYIDIQRLRGLTEDRQAALDGATKRDVVIERGPTACNDRSHLTAHGDDVVEAFPRPSDSQRNKVSTDVVVSVEQGSRR